MTEKQKRVQAAVKAARTLRLNLLAGTNLNEVVQLATDIIAKEFEVDDDVTRPGIIAREIGPTTWKSFCTFGSRRNASKVLTLIWISNKGVPLDEQAMYISEQYGIDISPDELAQFILQYDKGVATFEPYQELEQMKRAFKYLTGFNWHLKFVKAEVLKKTVDNQDISDLPF